MTKEQIQKNAKEVKCDRRLKWCLGAVGWWRRKFQRWTLNNLIVRWNNFKSFEALNQKQGKQLEANIAQLERKRDPAAVESVTAIEDAQAELEAFHGTLKAKQI